MSLISVAFPEEISIENTGLEEEKGDWALETVSPTLSHPNSLARKVTPWSLAAIGVCGAISTAAPAASLC